VIRVQIIVTVFSFAIGTIIGTSLMMAGLLETIFATWKELLLVVIALSIIPSSFLIGTISFIINWFRIPFYSIALTSYIDREEWEASRFHTPLMPLNAVPFKRFIKIEGYEYHQKLMNAARWIAYASINIGLTLIASELCSV